MKLTFAAIKSPTIIDSDTVEGKVGTKTVKVSRRMNGWEPRISVTVEGVTAHDDKATDADKVEFDELYYRAWLDRSHLQDKAREANSDTVKFLYVQ